MRVLRSLCAIAGLGLTLACAPAPNPSDAGALFFDGGRFVAAAPGPPPGENDVARWEPVALTDVWRDTRPALHGHGWYRFDFALEAVPSERWAAYLPGLASNAAVWVNGEFVGDGGRMEEPVSINSNRPLFFPFSPGLLRPGENRLDVSLFAYRGSFDRLEPLWIGPAGVLEAAYERQFFGHITLAQLASGLVIALLPFVGAIWLGSGRDPLYASFFATAAFWSISSFNYHARDLPVSFWTWEGIVHGSMDSAAVAGVFLAHRLVGVVRPRLERGLVGFAALSWLMAFFTSEAAQVDWSLRFHMVAVAITAYSVVVVGRRRQQLQFAELPVFVVAAAAFVGVALHDLVIQFDVVSMEAPRLLPLGGPLILLAFAGCLTARFLRAYERAERLNVELEERVNEKQTELESNYARLSHMERERALSQERDRIVREVHDGMGGKIVSSLALLETEGSPPERIAGTLRESLDDMRLLIHSLDPESGQLDALLGTLRERLERRLEGHALRIDWRVGELPEDVVLSPENALHVLRIVEEAFTNVLKHAAASRVEMATERVDGGVRLTIRDDGVGIASGEGGGIGVRSMRERAKAIGGRLAVTPREVGTEVALLIPA